MSTSSMNPVWIQPREQGVDGIHGAVLATILKALCGHVRRHGT